MDPDSGAYFKRSHITTLAIVTTLSFSAFYFYKEHRKAQEAKLKMAVKKDSTTIITASLPKEEQKVTVTKTNEPPASGKKKKTIYLTFDDGPNKGTQNVLNILTEEKIPATLFIIGQHVYGSHSQANIYDSLRNSAFVELANHSYTHAHNKFSHFYTMPEKVLEDFKRCADSLRFSSTIVRTPGRNIWRLNDIKHCDNPKSIAAADHLEKNGYTIMGWDLEWHFTNELKAVQSSEKLAMQVDSMFTHNRTRTKDHLVLLAHDQVYSNAKDSAALRKFVSILKQKGEYHFAFINRYPGIEKKPVADSSQLKN
ncbi:MAG TPA: polysaccharide deacetylase family protein [Ferruginibacter sp.]|nr:polysaccharide deacetylase family protein [Ferruginibacter sp.]HRE62431.1 polysaccharide deacetylase family protein [Ferruginibacter sp.]